MRVELEGARQGRRSGLVVETARRIAKRLIGPGRAASAAIGLGTRTIVRPSADTPTGIGSAPMVGSRHAPGDGLGSARRARAERPASGPVVVAIRGVVTSSPQVVSGTPIGRSSGSSLSGQDHCRPSSPAARRPATRPIESGTAVVAARRRVGPAMALVGRRRTCRDGRPGAARQQAARGRRAGHVAARRVGDRWHRTTPAWPLRSRVPIHRPARRFPR